MTITEMYTQREALLNKREQLNTTLADFASRESLADADEVKFKAAQREYEINLAQVSALNQAIELAGREKKNVKSAAEMMREELKAGRNARREITFGDDIKAGSNNAGSGAVQLTIKDLMPTLNEGLGLPASLHITTGVTGNVLVPYSIDDVEMEEVGENVALTDQNLNFKNATVSPKRVGLYVEVSNEAIDNAAFDLMSFVQNKFTLGLKKYLAKKIYSQANWTGNKGGFANATVGNSDTIAIGNYSAYKSILDAVAAFTNAGFDESGVCLVMDAATEADLKAEPKADGQGGFVIENGKCAGYDYVVSHYINTVLGGDAKTAGSNTDTSTLYATTNKYIGIAYFNYLSVQQHGDVRMVIDGTSAAMAKINKTAVVLNTEYSMTDLSKFINGGSATQAFKVFKVVAGSAPVKEVKVVNTTASPVNTKAVQ